MNQKKAIITGVTGQDGAYLTRLLLEKNYKVYGLKRRTSLINTQRLDEIFQHKNFKLIYYDLNDTGAIWKLLIDIKPDEFYNLAAQSHVRVSFEIPEHTVDGIAMGTLRILNAQRLFAHMCVFIKHLRPKCLEIIQIILLMKSLDLCRHLHMLAQKYLRTIW